jgi:hypothetical protein
MDALLLTGIIVALVLLVAGGVWLYMRAQRSRRLRHAFGPEYHAALAEAPNKRRAESELEERRKRVEALNIRPLGADERDAFDARWQDVQRGFVDEPSGAISDADELVREVMQARGYPVADFEQRAADLSVDHPIVVSRYRSAREVSVRNASGDATTEDLRAAMLDYRALFEELLEASPRDERQDAGGERMGSSSERRGSRRRV